MVEAELFISTNPEREGLFNRDDNFVQRPPASGITEGDLKTISNGEDDYNPNRVYTATWKDAGFGNGKGKWTIGGEELPDLLPPNIFPYTDRLNLTGGQEYYWGVRARSERKGWEEESGGSFKVPLAKPFVEEPDQPVPFSADPQDNYSSVTFITPEAVALDPQGLSVIEGREIAKKIVKDINGEIDGNASADGAVLQYDPATGDWTPIPGSQQPQIGRPLVLIADWQQDSIPQNYNSGFAEGAADSLFASLVELNIQQSQTDALFNSPFHFIGMGRGAVVNSEIIQRLGTYYPKPADPDNEEDPNYDNRNKFPDLQMTTVDPNDFEQENATGLEFSNYFDPTIQRWENVTFADNYYQTATFNQPRGRNLFNDIPAELLPPDSDTISKPDLSIDLGGYGNNNTLNPESRVGFTVEDNSQGKDPHYRTRAWYGGTVDIGWNKNESNSPFETFIHRRKGDFSRSELDPDPNNLLPWYTPNHTFQDLGDEDAQWEGIGTGWYYSVLGNGYFNRDLLNQENENSPVVPPQRTPLELDNTAEARMRGDYAVPTLFNGNFDATYSKNSAQSIPGWTIHHNDNNPNNISQQSALSLWSEIRVDNTANYPDNYALKLSSGQSITHNRLVVPDWGTLRFDLHTGDVPATSTDRLQVTLEATDGSEISTQIELQDADGTKTKYLSDTRRIDYGETGFETFTLDVPDNLRGKVATLKFELAGGQEIYLDNIFFKSQHLLFGNSSEARKPDAPNSYFDNYLLEKPQYAVSYHRDRQTPNWVAHYLNKSWIDGTRRDDFNEDPTLPSSWYKVPGDAYTRTYGYDRGHLSPALDRARTNKDAVAGDLMTNMIPQNPSNNSGFWRTLEIDLRKLVDIEPASRELYIVTGASDSQGRFTRTDKPGLNVNIPSNLWKVVLVLDNPGSDISDVDENTLAFAVYAPNDESVLGNNWKVPANNYVFPVDFVESQTNFDFLSNIPIHIQDRIESIPQGQIYQRIDDLFNSLPNASLLADSTQFGNSRPAAIIANRTIGHSGFTEDISFVGDEFSSSQEIGGLESTASTSSLEPTLPQISSNKISSQTTIEFDKLGSLQIGSIEQSSINTSIPETSITQVGFTEISSDQLATIEIGTSQVGTTQIGTSQVGTFKPGSTQVSPSQVRSNQFNAIELGVGQIDSSQISQNQVNSFDSNSSKISFASSIPSEQFFSVHKSTPAITNVLNNTATNIWLDLLQSETQLDINFQITDLPTGQLAEATITDFDDSGVPNAGTISIDHDANGVGWFIDSTPLDNSEFVTQDTDSYLLAAAESEANGKYDLLTTVLHELAHLYGFIEGYSGFDRLVSEGWGEVVFDGSHLDKEAHPNDLMNTHLAPGVRKLPSDLDVEILRAILAEDAEETRRQGNLEAALTSEPLLAIANGDFSISDTTTNTFAWDTRGASNIENGQAVLTEDSPFLSNFTQSFTVPEEAKTVKFKLIGAELGASEFAPPDAFEVALLDANTNESLVIDNDLTATDSLLNIQNDGTAYFSDKVRISGAASGEIIELDKSHTITVDISHLEAGTEATLYFDLLGFGDVDSRVVIDDVQLSDQNLIPPVTIGDSATTTQGQPVIIDILANDRDDDGTIAVNSVQIATEPNSGFVIPRGDGTVSYIPDIGFAGEDSFTYVVQDNDGQFSEPATVNITVTNVAPEISEIQIPDNIIEGTEITLKAIASDAGNDDLTYTWEFDDGTTASGQNIPRTYGDNGTYTGTLTVTDIYGDSDSQSFEVVVGNAAPVVDAGSDRTVDEGSTVTFNGSFSDTGINDTHTVTWDFGDGETADTSNAALRQQSDKKQRSTYNSIKQKTEMFISQDF